MTLPVLAFTLAMSMSGQNTAILHKQYTLDKDLVPPANYSGITWIGDNRYAVVSDEEPNDGFYIFNIDLDSNTGKVISAKRYGYFSTPAKKLDKWGSSIRDIEAIAYRPQSNTFYMAGEGDQRVIEYNEKSQPTGREFNIPQVYALNNIRPNKGFESLTYNQKTDLFWTTTEATLKSDGACATANRANVENLMRITSFNANLQPTGQYAYKMEKPLTSFMKKAPKKLIYGISDLCALDDGQIIVMEREIHVAENYLNSFCNIRLFLVYPTESKKINSSSNLQELPNNKFLKKEEICTFKTEASLKAMNIANYEGISLGPCLKDGRRTLLLINDSQNGEKKGPFRLKDYLKVIVIDD